MAAPLLRRLSSHLASVHVTLPPISSSMPPPHLAGGLAPLPPPAAPALPRPSPDAAMELMAVPKKKVSKYKKGLRNGPRALKPIPVIVRCRCCGKVKLPHFYCCSGDRGNNAPESS